MMRYPRSLVARLGRWLPRRLYHRVTWDLRGVTDVERRKLLQVALDACDFPFHRIRKATGARVPVTVSDLSRYAPALDERGHGEVWFGHGGLRGRLLGDPARRAALGLFWLPTPTYPAGRVELDRGVMSDPPLAREVFLAEAAHVVDYAALTLEQRRRILALFHDTPGHPSHGSGDPGPDGWFEGHGDSYWGWPGERWMGLFMAAFAPGLPRPLEARQPWTHSYDAADVAAVREILR